MSSAVKKIVIEFIEENCANIIMSYYHGKSFLEYEKTIELIKESKQSNIYFSGLCINNGIIYYLRQTYKNPKLGAFEHSSLYSLNNYSLQPHICAYDTKVCKIILDLSPSYLNRCFQLVVMDEHIITINYNDQKVQVIKINKKTGKIDNYYSPANDEEYENTYKFMCRNDDMLYILTDKQKIYVFSLVTDKFEKSFYLENNLFDDVNYFVVNDEYIYVHIFDIYTGEFEERRGRSVGEMILIFTCNGNIYKGIPLSYEYSYINDIFVHDNIIFLSHSDKTSVTVHNTEPYEKYYENKLEHTGNNIYVTSSKVYFMSDKGKISIYNRTF
jgi:hypothetical protein